MLSSYNEALSRISFSGKIHLITTDDELSLACLALGSAKELGFDTETKPSFKKGEIYQVALLQLSTDTDAYIIRLHQVTRFDLIQKIFENENIILVGAAIRDDLNQLQKIFKFIPRQFVELQSLAKEKGLKNFGLKGMAEEILQSTFSKRSKLTNWEAKILTEQQLIYAATDAWIGLKLYQKLIKLP